MFSKLNMALIFFCGFLCLRDLVAFIFRHKNTKALNFAKHRHILVYNIMIMYPEFQLNKMIYSKFYYVNKIADSYLGRDEFQQQKPST